MEHGAASACCTTTLLCNSPSRQIWHEEQQALCVLKRRLLGACTKDLGCQCRFARGLSSCIHPSIDHSAFTGVRTDRFLHKLKFWSHYFLRVVPYVTTLTQLQVAWATAWVAWAAWGVWVEAWGVWAQATVTRAVTVTRQGTASKHRQGRALGEEAWAGATANRPRQGLGARGAGMASKGAAVMGDKQAAEGLEALATDPTDTPT